VRLSQADLADLLDVSRATVSEATSEGHKCRGYPVRAWAKFDGSGRVSGYDVPSHVVERSNPAGTSGGSDVPSLTGMERKLMEQDMKEADPGSSMLRSCQRAKITPVPLRRVGRLM